MNEKKLELCDIELLKNSIKENYHLIQEPDIENDKTKMYYSHLSVGFENPKPILRLYVVEDKQAEFEDCVLAYYDIEDISTIMDLRTKVKNYAEFKKELLALNGIQRVKIIGEDFIFKNSKKSLFGLYILG
jgi:hypothetical protein